MEKLTASMGEATATTSLKNVSGPFKAGTCLRVADLKAGRQTLPYEFGLQIDKQVFASVYSDVDKNQQSVLPKEQSQDHQDSADSLEQPLGSLLSLQQPLSSDPDWQKPVPTSAAVAQTQQQLIDSIAAKVEYLLASTNFTTTESPQLVFRLNAELFANTDLTLSYDRDRWLLKVKTQDKRLLQAVRQGADKLNGQFADADLGNISVISE